MEKIKEGNYFRLCWVVISCRPTGICQTMTAVRRRVYRVACAPAAAVQTCVTTVVCVQPRSSAVNMSLPAFAAERRCCWRLAPAAVDRRSAANPPHAAATVERWDRDGRTDTRPFRKPFSTYCPGCVSSDSSSGLWLRFVC